MQAFGHDAPRRLDDPSAIIEIDAPEPEMGPDDLLVSVRAASVNPVDSKVRQNLAPEAGPRILGWDAAGDVVAVGANVSGFAPGDAVYYAGDLTRPGSNAERQAVDHRLAAKKPTSLDYAAAAALPLTTITAWEMLFDRFRLQPGAQDQSGSVLVVGGAGGVGSIAIQLAKTLTPFTVLATASRPETGDWVRELGADHVINHSAPFAEAVKAAVPGGVSHAFSTNGTGTHWAQIIEAMAPQGHIGLIDDPEQLDASLLKLKSLTLTWEFMFTRSMFATADIGAQGALLARTAALIDDGRLRTTLADHLGKMSVETLRKAHGLLESGRSRGKIVLDVA
ncbi:MAG: zinc-binding alcohol dehydrogenase family protein [Pseudomonadota bacterium]